MAEYFDFVEIGIEEGKKTFRYDLMSHKGEFLGSIKYYPAWRQYCFFPEEGTMWSTGCLNDVMAFLEEINRRTG